MTSRQLRQTMTTTRIWTCREMWVDRIGRFWLFIFVSQFTFSITSRHFFFSITILNRRHRIKSIRPISNNRGYITPTSTRIQQRRKMLRWYSIESKLLIRSYQVRRIDRFMICLGRRDWRLRDGRWFRGESVYVNVITRNSKNYFGYFQERIAKPNPRGIWTTC